jgi:hypothetical protein
MGALIHPDMPAWFRAQMARMVGLRFVPQDLRTHWEGLSDIPEALLEAAVSEAQRKCHNFPTPWQVRTFADQARRVVCPVPPDEDRTVPLPAPMVIGHLPTGRPIVALRTWRYYCEDCSDSGLRTYWCGPPEGGRPWLTRLDCGRSFEHAAHEWVKACACAASNPDVQRRKAKAQHEAPRGRNEHD